MTTIKIKRGTGAPTSGDLDTAEMGLDTSAGVVYISTDGTDVVKVGEVTLDGTQTLTNKTLTSPAINTGISGTAVLDDDTFATASATTIATSESIKAYVDNEISGTSANIAGLSSSYTGTGDVLQITNNTSGPTLIVGKQELGYISNIVFKGGGDSAVGMGHWERPAGTVNNGGTNYILGSADNLSLAGSVSVNSNDGNRNIAIGYQVMSSLTRGHSNVGIGHEALNSVTIGIDNVAIGIGAGENLTDGSQNVLVGAYAGFEQTTADKTTCVGWNAGRKLAGTGADAFGYHALRNATTGTNAAFAHNALENCTTGSGNVAVGRYSLNDLTTGNYNTAVGYNALTDATGSSNTAVGYNAGSSNTTGSNNTNIGNSASSSSVTVSNQITLGNSSVTSLRCNVTSISSLSDMRDKTNIADLEGASNFIKNLEPVSFDWARRDETLQGVQSHGFLAQQLQSAQDSTGYQVPGLVFDDNPDKLEAAYGNLLPTMVAALKEALTEIDELKAKVAALESA